VEAPYSRLGGAAASQANGPASAGWWKRPSVARLPPRTQRPSRTFPEGELFHSPGLPRQRLPGVPGPKWSWKPVGLRLTSLHVTPCDCHTCRASDNPSSPARQRPHTTSSRADAGGHTPRGLSRHGKTADGAVLQVGPRRTSPPQNLSFPLSRFSSLGRQTPSHLRPGGRPYGRDGTTPPNCFRRKTPSSTCLASRQCATINSLEVPE
jgi:hypothetical protein